MGSPSITDQDGVMDVSHRGVLGTGSPDFCTAALVPRSRDRHCPHLVPWRCAPQVALHTVGGTLVSAQGPSGRKAQLGNLSLAAKGPQGHHGVLTSSPEWPLLPQASCSSWALPSRALLPEGGWVGRGSFLLSSPRTSVSSHALAFRGADPPDNWAWRGADQDG